MSTFSCQPLRLIGLLFISFALFSIAGGHWTLLQGIAWSTMIHTYSTGSSFSKALEKTFSGNYPCALCKKIAQEKQKEKQKKESFEKSTKKKTGLLETTFSLLTLDSKKWSYQRVNKDNYSPPKLEPPAPYPITP